MKAEDVKTMLTLMSAAPKNLLKLTFESEVHDVIDSVVLTISRGYVLR